MARAYVDRLPEGWAATRLLITALRKLGYEVSEVRGVKRRLVLG